MTNPYQSVIDECKAALASVRERIPAQLYEDVSSYIGAGEWGLGMEVLVSQLNELDIKVTREQLALLERPLKSMNVASGREFEYLRKHGLE